MRDDRRYSTLSMLEEPFNSTFPPSPTSMLLSSDNDDDSFDLLPLHPAASRTPDNGVEELAQTLLGPQHLAAILSNPVHLAGFAEFLARRQGGGLKMLVYYLDATKAQKALGYANAIMAGLDEDGDEVQISIVTSKELERRCRKAFDALLTEMAAYVTATVVEVVSHNVARRIVGELRRELVEAVDGLGECFCLTDPRREDNPIIFMSEGKGRKHFPLDRKTC